MTFAPSMSGPIGLQGLLAQRQSPFSILNLPMSSPSGNPIPTAKPGLGGLLSNPSGVSGLMADPVFMAGMGLLSAGQDSRINPIQSALQGMQMAQQTGYLSSKRKREEEDSKLDRRYKEARITALNEGKAAPSNVQEWEYFSKLAPEQQQQYLAMKRATQVKDFGGYFGSINPLNNQVSTVGEKTLPPEKTPGYLSDAEGAKVTGKEQAQAQVDAQISLPGEESKATRAINLVDQLLEHPGLEKSAGWQSMFPSTPGSQASDFEAKIKQLGGMNFLEAFQSLKGGGHITEIEGQKAEQAISNLTVKQSDAQLKETLEELQNIYRRGLERKRTMAGVGAPQSGQVVDGYKFNGGDPSDPNSWTRI